MKLQFYYNYFNLGENIMTIGLRFNESDIKHVLSSIYDELQLVTIDNRLTKRNLEVGDNDIQDIIKYINKTNENKNYSFNDPCFVYFNRAIPGTNTNNC